MELKTFIEEVLVGIVDAVEDAQSQSLYAEMAPNRDPKSGEMEIEFDLTVAAEDREGDKSKVVVIAATVGGSGTAPAPGGPPPTGKLKFKIPVRLPQRRGCWLSRWIEYVSMRRKRNAASKPAKQPQKVPREKDEEENGTNKRFS